jgi:hypothetical protein
MGNWVGTANPEKQMNVTVPHIWDPQIAAPITKDFPSLAGESGSHMDLSGWDTDANFFKRILTGTRQALGAVTNLALGAVAVPDGLAIVTSDYVYMPMILDIAAPQWMPVHSRHPDFRQACNHIVHMGRQLDCLRMLENDLASKYCPSTVYLQKEFLSIIRSFQRRYEGVTNPAFYASLHHAFCKNNADLCMYVNGTSRVKRGIGMFVLAGAAMAGGKHL